MRIATNFKLVTVQKKTLKHNINGKQKKSWQTLY